MKKFASFTLLLLLSLSTSVLKAQSDVPVSFQVTILKKILIADQVIKSRGEGNLVIVHDEASAERAQLFISTFAKVGVKAIAVTSLNDVNGQNIHAIYYLTSTIERPSFITKERILTIGGTSENVESGKSALALRNVNGKPEVVVNKKVLYSEGHDELLSSLPKAVIL